MKWFNNPQTLEDLKKEYKKLVFKHHPDRGGRTEDMQEINAEYDRLFAKLKNVHKSASGETYTAKEDNTETPEQFREILEKLIHLDGIDIEICGSWVWVTGNTFVNRDTLKELHFKYSRNKNAWYYHQEGYVKHSRKTFTLEQIRDLWGSERVDTTPQDKLATANA
ncbi:MAG: molecular chaperone DnaJ [Clostridia bacterium]|nr:molecular chaperone DnaJ [Clostridia bacterium]